MASPAEKRFIREYKPIADAVSRLDIDQTVREQVADALTEALAGRRDFAPKLFRLLASDPLTACAGPGEGEPCPYGRELRIGMHNSRDPLGRSAVWEPRKPSVQCANCGLATRVGA